jgi:hypothetical protein
VLCDARAPYFQLPASPPPDEDNYDDFLDNFFEEFLKIVAEEDLQRFPYDERLEAWINSPSSLAASEEKPRTQTPDFVPESIGVAVEVPRQSSERRCGQNTGGHRAKRKRQQQPQKQERTGKATKKRCWTKEINERIRLGIQEAISQNPSERIYYWQIMESDPVATHPFRRRSSVDSLPNLRTHRSIGTNMASHLSRLVGTCGICEMGGLGSGPMAAVSGSAVVVPP